MAADKSMGLFESESDVGVTPKQGSAKLDAAAKEYLVTGGGENIWKDADAFHFVWVKLSGNAALTADLHFIGTGAVAHRKAALMFRQSLEPGSAYADVALHGDGLTSLQYRPSAGAQTAEVRSELKGPSRLRIERRGDEFTILVGESSGELKPSGPVTVVLQDPVYVGLAVCSHDAQVLETASFSGVRIEKLP